MNGRTRMFATQNKQIVIAGVGDLVLTCVGPGQVSDDLWTEHLSQVAEFLSERTFTSALNYTPHFAPNTTQRHIMQKRKTELAASDNVKKIALLSDSAFVRGGVTALQWIMKFDSAVKPFKPDMYREALAWLREFTRFDVDDAASFLREIAVYTGHGRLS